MESIKIRNFYGSRILEKIHKTRSFISKIICSSPFYNKLDLDETPRNISVFPPNFWKGDTKRGRSFLKTKNFNIKNIKNDFFFYYHSFSWLTDLRTLGNENLRIYSRELTKQWIKNNQSWNSKTWKSYIVASRLCSWIHHFDFFFLSSKDDFKEKIFNLIIKQVNHLVKNFSYHKRNSELIRIIKALIYVSICVPHKNSLYQIAIFNLKTEITKQILKDGCHFQRNPKIHMEVLYDLIDIRSILNIANKKVFIDLQSAIEKMSVVNYFFLHKDNSLALFNQSTNVSSEFINEIISHIPKPKKIPRELSESGFQRVDTKDTVLILDCGVPQNYNATYKCHSCTGGFEISYKKKRIIVNSSPNFKNNINKSTAAHSTLTLNNTNAYKVLNNDHLSRIPETIKVKRVERYGANFLEIENYSYKQQYDATHKRLIYVDKNGTDIRGEENIYCPSELTFDIRFYLDESIKASEINNGKAILLKLPNGTGWKFISSFDKINLVSSQYIEISKQPKISEHIHLTGNTSELISVVKWSLKKY